MNDPEVLESWEKYLGEFDHVVWPTMQSFGYTKGQAFQFWMLNRIANAVEVIADFYTTADDEKPEWEK